LIEAKTQGVYTVTGPKKPATFGSLLISCREAAESDARFIWVDESYLLAEDVTPWSDLPLWVPTSDPAYAGFYSINISKALKAGLEFRPLSRTVADTLTWLKARPAGFDIKSGLSLARETELLIKYQERKSH
jgi:2'-hydroxyisoflavone reductase